MTHDATAIVQARMGSARCPGKSMELVGGIPAVVVVLRRLAKAKMIDKVVLATSDLARDDVLARSASEAGFLVFRGDETDLVGRYIAAAGEHASGPYIVRATGDNVFMDWTEVDRQVEAGITGDWDFVGFENPEMPERENDFGAEFIRVTALNKLDGLTDKEYDREHVNPYFYEHPEIFRVTRIPVAEALRTPVKLDLDTPDDLRLIKFIGDAVSDPIEVRAAEVVRIAETISVG
jgi:spore coat polysaccharide biosynthesis protein SpsF (cytidylyltransferase family)